MSCLIINLEGPLQAWGLSSKFTHRGTAPMPTRSAIVGLLCNAMGLDREANLTMFDDVRMAVRTERAGTLVSDFHTVRQSEDGNSTLTWRDMLQDARFTVFVEAEDKLLDRFEQALIYPARQPYLGRRALVPAAPLLVGRAAMGVREAVQSHPAPEGSVGGPWWVDAEPGEQTQLRRDEPVSFDPRRRRHGLHHIVVGEHAGAASAVEEDHDPLSLFT